VSESLYELYKDALRRGHVAGLRGQVDEAIAAYRHAADLAPERTVPHSSLGAVLGRSGRFDEALIAYEAALRLAPRDEVALEGRADTLARSGRWTEAAHAFDVLADMQEADGRFADACDSARRALEQAESKARRRHVEALTRTLDRTIGDRAGEIALTRALRVLEGTLPALAHAPVRPAAAVETGKSAGSEPARDPGPATDPAGLAGEADVALEAGDLDTARVRLLAAAAGYLGEDHLSAALDACYQALAIAPVDPEIHLALVEIYLASGWRTPAQEKLLLLGRLIDLDGDVAARGRLCDVVASRFPDEPRLAALCA
jgi:tetratricopeptide (TPR) repeat protein